MTSAYSYIRFSNPEQSRGNSLDRQLNLSCQLAKKHKWILDETLSLKDLGVSAFRGTNATEGNLKTFFKAIENGLITPGSVLIIESLDRLSRQQLQSALTLILNILNAKITIATTTPEKIYKPPVELAEAVELLVVLSRANEESETKSRRLSAAWHKKRQSKEPLTAICPAWLTLNPTTNKYELNKHAETIRLIFRLSYEGMGNQAIAKYLTKHTLPTIGRAKHWWSSYIKKILNNRACIGEYQPHTKVNRVRKPIGEPITNYFPAVVPDDVFYKTQSAIHNRTTRGGKIGKHVNLFSGLLWDMVNQSSMQIVDKGDKKGVKSIVSTSAMRGNGVYLSFPLEPLENTILQSLRDKIKPSDFVAVKTKQPPKPQPDALQGEIDALVKRQSQLANLLITRPDIDAITEAATKITMRLAELRKQLQEATQNTHNPPKQTATELLDLVSLLEECQKEKRIELRLKIRQRLRQLVKRIELDITKHRPYFKTTSGVIHFYQHEKIQFSCGYDSRTKATYGMAQCFDPQQIDEWKQTRKALFRKKKQV